MLRALRFCLCQTRRSLTGGLRISTKLRPALWRVDHRPRRQTTEQGGPRTARGVEALRPGPSPARCMTDRPEYRKPVRNGSASSCSAKRPSERPLSSTSPFDLCDVLSPRTVRSDHQPLASRAAGVWISPRKRPVMHRTCRLGPTADARVRHGPPPRPRCLPPRSKH